MHIKPAHFYTIGLLSILLTFLQAIVATHQLKSQPSSFCLGCSLPLEIIFYSLFQLILTLSLLWVLKKYKASKGFIILSLGALLMCWWFYTTNSILDDRVYTRAKFLPDEAFWYTFQLAIYPILFCGVLLVWVLSSILKKKPTS